MKVEYNNETIMNLISNMLPNITKQKYDFLKILIGNTLDKHRAFDKTFLDLIRMQKENG